MTVIFVKHRCPQHKCVWLMEDSTCPKCAGEKLARAIKKTIGQVSGPTTRRAA